MALLWVVSLFVGIGALAGFARSCEVKRVSDSAAIGIMALCLLVPYLPSYFRWTDDEMLAELVPLVAVMIGLLLFNAVLALVRAVMHLKRMLAEVVEAALGLDKA